MSDGDVNTGREKLFHMAGLPSPKGINRRLFRILIRRARPVVEQSARGQ